MTRRPVLISILATLFASACGSPSSPNAVAEPPAGQTVVVQTAPAEATVAPGGTVQFGAQVTGTTFTSVNWSVVEAGGGTVDAGGLYRAPASQGTFHVRADSAIASVQSSGTSIVHVVSAPAQQVTVAVSPGVVNLQPGGSATFAAAVGGTTNLAVTWTVQEGSSCGSVTSAGVYIAPNAASTCHVVATSQADTTKSGSATVTITPAPVVTVSVSPATASMTTGGTRTFSATVSGTTAGQSTAVTWSVPAGAGSIGATTGVYVAPATPGTYVVTATSVADPTKFATATVTVTAAPVIAVSVTPATASVLTSGTVTFTATVTGTTAGQSTAATWSVPAGAGSIGASTGVYVAPATAGTYIVTATSVADGTKKGTAAVTVTAPPPAVAISISPTTATLDACKGQVFTATVTNTTNTAVTWTVTEGAAGGSVAGNGLYTAPQAVGTFHVVATSVADPTKTVQGTITVGPEKVLSVAVVPGSLTVQPSGAQTFAAKITTTCGTFDAQ